jgi:putative ABC transport system permease protein
VVQDFNFQSLHHRIEPLVIFIGGGQQYMSIRLNTADVSNVVAKIEALWQNASPGTPFEASFLDDRFQDLYQAEQKTGSISFVFSFLAIFIACIGLLGLATFTIQQRIKEIGIRKVLGSSTHGIISLISKDFIVIIGVSICFAFPLAWYLMHQWLYEFEYRTNLNIWVFITSGVGVLVMAILIVSLQSLRAAWMNPVNAIRVE